MMVDSKGDNEKKPHVELRTQWVVIAQLASRMMAEFVVNGLKAHDIPAVLDSRAGFLGTAGLSLQAFVSGNAEDHKVLVPAQFEEEAREVVEMFLGDEEAKDDKTDAP
jgi:hypothetical protein